jgi:hypothetical protein
VILGRERLVGCNNTALSLGQKLKSPRTTDLVDDMPIYLQQCCPLIDFGDDVIVPEFGEKR